MYRASRERSGHEALSIRQPWAHAIMRLGKRVENRDWAGCSYRGPILLHASKTLVLRHRKGEPETFGDAVESIIEIVKPHGAEMLTTLAPFAYSNGGIWRPAPTLPFGGIVGRARIVAAGRSATLTAGLRSPWYAGGFALVLADVEPLPFIPWRGSLGFFEVPDDLLLRAATTMIAEGV